VPPPRPAVAVSPQPGWRNLRILAIPGSLRAASSNATLLDSAAALTPGNVEVIVYRGLAALPHFNPDLDNDLVSLPVSEFRSQLRISDGILFSTPEYAHGIPGVLKNALDWVVSSGDYTTSRSHFSALLRARPTRKLLLPRVSR